MKAESTSRSDAGLPEHAHSIQVVHNRAGAKTIVEFRLPGRPLRHRLYWSNTGATRYHVLGAPTELQSFEHAVTCEAPRLFFCAIEWGNFKEDARGARLGIYVANLEGEPSAVCLDIDGIFPDGTSVCRVLRADDGGTQLDVIVAIRHGGVDSFEMLYSICRLDLVTRSAQELDRLPGVFY